MATQPKPDEAALEPAADAGGAGDKPPLAVVGADEGGEGVPRDFDAEASQHGWVPEAEFKGDPSRWVDAETFVKRADEVMPLLKKQNEHLKREVTDLKKQTRRIVDHFEKDRARLQSELDAKIDAAAADGDAEEVKRLRGEEKELNKASASAEVTREEALEALDDFRDRNPWYDKANLASATELEINARLYADRMTEKNLAKTAEMGPADFYAMIEGLVAERYPAIRAKPARQKPASDVAGPTGGRQPAPRGRSFADLPPEAQQACDKWVKQGLIKDRTAYVSSYQWS